MLTNTSKQQESHYKLSTLRSAPYVTEVKTDRSVGQRANRPVQADLWQARLRVQDDLFSLTVFSVVILIIIIFFALGRFHSTYRHSSQFQLATP